MTCAGFLIFLGFIVCCLPAGEGGIISPAEGKEYVFLPGSTGNITWVFTDDISSLLTRTWRFMRRGGSTKEFLGLISGDNAPQPDASSSLSGVEMKRPATLLLKNVNQSYNGKYEFLLTTKFNTDAVGVNVFIAKNPSVTLNCSHSSPIVLNEGDDFICVCRGVDGNPPANVNWYEDNIQIGVTKKEINTLTLRNVSGTANGTYKCEARSHANDSYKDEKSVELRVRPNSKPIIKSFTSNPHQPVNGKPVTLTCESDGVPEPDYVIKFKNGSVASTVKTFEIPKMGSSYVGVYTCIAKNIKGNDSAVLNVTGQGSNHGKDSFKFPETKISEMTNSPTTTNFGTAKAPSKECNCAGKTEWYIVMVSLFSGVIIGILLSYIILSFRRKFGSKNTQSNPEPQTTGVDPTYQELDLSKMNKEDNYQSLRVNAASNDVANDDDSTYTELNQVRDVENNYQSST